MLAGALQTWVYAFAFDIQILSDIEVLEIALFLFKRCVQFSLLRKKNDYSKLTSR